MHAPGGCHYAQVPASCLRDISACHGKLRVPPYLRGHDFELRALGHAARLASSNGVVVFLFPVSVTKTAIFVSFSWRFCSYFERWFLQRRLPESILSLRFLSDPKFGFSQGFKYLSVSSFFTQTWICDWQLRVLNWEVLLHILKTICSRFITTEHYKTSAAAHIACITEKVIEMEDQAARVIFDSQWV